MYYTNTFLGLTAIMGVIMLIGIVVNNAILILDYTNQLIRGEEKMKVKEALIKAAPEKLKPIIMSTTAIILGLLPMAIGIGSAGKEMRIPLGIVSIGGLVASTFLTLIVIPVAYYVVAGFFNRVKLLFARMFGQEIQA
jgi:HAE1 family hydrophobic/amphiphilic exporter-1